MTRSELAEVLNGREISHEMDKSEEREAAAEAGLVVVFGYSDDGVELRGVIDDELSAYGGTTIHLNAGGLVQNKCDDDDCPNFAGFDAPGNRKIEALWCEEKDGPAWTYKTDIPHSTFDIMEEGDVFCRGIVFEMWEVTR